MPTPIAFWIGLVVTIASALYFADTRMKTSDNWFRGFPALWNVLAFYLFVFRLPFMANVAILIVAVALMFLPIVFVHPTRVVKMRVFTVAATVLWGLCAVVATIEDLSADPWTKTGLAVTALYFMALPLLRHSFWAESDEG